MVTNLLATDINLIKSILDLLGIKDVNYELVQSIELTAEIEKPVFVSIHTLVSDNEKTQQTMN